METIIDKSEMTSIECDYCGGGERHTNDEIVYGVVPSIHGNRIEVAWCRPQWDHYHKSVNSLLKREAEEFGEKKDEAMLAARNIRDAGANFTDLVVEHMTARREDVRAIVDLQKAIERIVEVVGNRHVRSADEVMIERPQ